MDTIYDSAFDWDIPAPRTLAERLEEAFDGRTGEERQARVSQTTDYGGAAPADAA